MRALAHKWVKIILAMQRTGCPYVEAVFVDTQQSYLLKQQALAALNETFCPLYLT